MNSLRQLVPKELELDMTRLTHLNTWAEMKKYVLDPVFGTKKSKDSTYTPMDIGNIDDASSKDEEESITTWP